MERKIGEIFEFSGEWYQCIPDTTDDNCNNCFFQKSCSDIAGDCSSTARSDGKSVAFKKLEKVGEPYIIGNKLIQRYKMYPTTYHINVYGWYYHNLDVKSWTIDIEVKQTKEDMEENKTNFVGAIDALCKRYNMSDGVRTDFMSELKEIIKDKEKCDLKPFNLEAAKAGKPVCTRDVRKARIICFDRRLFWRNVSYPILALVERSNGEDDVCMYNEKGKVLIEDDAEYKDDLMMFPEKKEGWVNVYKVGARLEIGGDVHSTKDAAIKCIDSDKKHIATVKIEWEELYGMGSSK